MTYSIYVIGQHVHEHKHKHVYKHMRVCESKLV